MCSCRVISLDLKLLVAGIVPVLPPCVDGISAVFPVQPAALGERLVFFESTCSNSQLLGQGGACIKGDTSSALLPVEDAAPVDRPSRAHTAVLMVAPRDMGSACYEVFVLLLLLASGALNGQDRGCHEF